MTREIERALARARATDAQLSALGTELVAIEAGRMDLIAHRRVEALERELARLRAQSWAAHRRAMTLRDRGIQRTITLGRMRTRRPAVRRSRPIGCRRRAVSRPTATATGDPDPEPPRAAPPRDAAIGGAS